MKQNAVEDASARKDDRWAKAASGAGYRSGSSIQLPQLEPIRPTEKEILINDDDNEQDKHRKKKSKKKKSKKRKRHNDSSLSSSSSSLSESSNESSDSSKETRKKKKKKKKKKLKSKKNQKERTVTPPQVAAPSILEHIPDARTARRLVAANAAAGRLGIPAVFHGEGKRLGE